MVLRDGHVRQKVRYGIAPEPLDYFQEGRLIIDKVVQHLAVRVSIARNYECDKPPSLLAQLQRLLSCAVHDALQ